jgi:hypothetical protein
MALIKCPECAKPISQTAESCPSCGYKLNNSTDSSSYTRRILLIVAICLGIFGVIVGFTAGSPAFGAAGAVAVVVSGIKLALMT